MRSLPLEERQKTAEKIRRQGERFIVERAARNRGNAPTGVKKEAPAYSAQRSQAMLAATLIGLIIGAVFFLVVYFEVRAEWPSL